MATFQQYSDALLRCLGTYQFIEEGLRFCLVRYHATTLFRLDGLLPYKVPVRAIEDAALGRLVDWMKTYCNNDELLSQLRQVKSKRDRLAHRGLVLNLNQQGDAAFLETQVDELALAHEEAQKCFQLLVAQMETADEIVRRAQQTLAAEKLARGAAPPEPFRDQEPAGQ